MENELDLTLRLGLPVPTVRTQLSLHTPNTHQEINVAAGGRRVNNNNNNGGGRMFGMNENNEGARINVNVDINLRVYNYVFQKFAGVGETLNFAPIRMPSPPAPAPATPTGTDYVLIDVPSRRAHRNRSLAMENAPDANPNRNANAKRHRGPGGFCGCCGKADHWKYKCTNKNCNAINTPMWRRGPLGPKTLCNACGIKFRKEEERRAKRD